MIDGYLEPLGRAESCGNLIPERELISLSWRNCPETLVCDDCYSDTKVDLVALTNGTAR